MKWSCRYLAYIWHICLLLPSWQWLKPLEQELLVDIFESLHPLSLCIWICWCILDFTLSTSDNNIAVILFSKRVIFLKQPRRAFGEMWQITEHVCFSQDLSFRPMNSTSESPTRILPRLCNRWCMEKMNEFAYIWNLMFKTLLNWGPYLVKTFQCLKPSHSKVLRQVANASICLCPIDFHSRTKADD